VKIHCFQTPTGESGKRTLKDIVLLFYYTPIIVIKIIITTIITTIKREQSIRLALTDKSGKQACFWIDYIPKRVYPV